MIRACRPLEDGLAGNLLRARHGIVSRSLGCCSAMHRLTGYRATLLGVLLRCAVLEKGFMSRRLLLGLGFLVAGGLAVHVSALRGGEPAKKAPVPAKDVQSKAEALVREVFKSEFAKAEKDSAARARLALTLLQEGRETGDFPAARYVLFRTARDLAAQAGDAPTALQAIEELAVHFDIPDSELFQLKVHALLTAGTAPAASELNLAIVDG
jgi:hypothetical protein